MQFKRFVTDRSGGVAPFLALAVVPVMGFMAAAVDYSRANAARTAMQNALDATALTLSKTAQGMDTAALSARAEQIFAANFDRPEVQNPTVTTQFSSPQQSSFVLDLTGSGSVTTVFARLIGQSEISFAVTSQVLWGIKKLNLALALDNTGSMASSGKMSALKTAAHNLLDTLKKAETTPGDIKVSIIPFATDVNVGTTNVDASWIRWDKWEEKNGDWSGPQGDRTWTPDPHSTWNGCVNDRDQNYDVLAAAPVGTTTQFPAHQASSCPAAMMPLSTNWSDLHSKVDEMTPTGNTNVTIGLAWAWQTLAPVEPMNAPPESPDLDKVIILLTDGDNTQNRWTGSTYAIDARTEKVCDNVKAANIRVYTVRVIDGDAGLLRNCATKPDMYYDVEEADELNIVFESIAQNLANLRIGK